MMQWITRAVTHGFALVIGIALGIYLLPILTAPMSPSATALKTIAEEALYTGKFTRDLKGSDFLHWGEGEISITPHQIVLRGQLAPGPDYKLYLVKTFVEDEAEFLAVKDRAQEVGDVKTFDGLMLDVPAGINVSAYNTVVIWCESFAEFITAAKYR